MDIEERIFTVVSNGFSPEDTQEWTQKFYNHRSLATRRDLGTDLTFDQYLNKVSQAGLVKPADIGRNSGQFVLARVGDVGDYRVDNCRFIPAEDNIREAHENGRHIEGNAIRSVLLSNRNKGQTKETSEVIRKMAETKTGRTKANDPGRLAQSEKLSKEFVLIAPDGTVHQGKNVVEFCKQHDLQSANVYAVFAGKKSHHKGWTGKYSK